MSNENLITARQVAEMLGIHVKTFYRLYNNDKTMPRHILLGDKSFRWRPADIRAWINTREAK